MKGAERRALQEHWPKSAMPRGLQCCWYGWRGPWLRCFFQRYEAPTPMRYVYRWRIAIGPLDVRRWSTLRAPAPTPRP